MAKSKFKGKVAASNCPGVCWNLGAMEKDLGPEATQDFVEALERDKRHRLNSFNGIYGKPLDYNKSNKKGGKIKWAK